MRHAISILVPLAVIALLPSCTPADNAAAVNAAQGRPAPLTVGAVQRQIKVGMSNADVVDVLGSPNMVTTDDQRRENWVYDRVSTDTAYATSSGGINLLVLGVGASSGARSTTQRTLTIVIKFDQASRVRDFAYRSSSF
jgi:outer membrane protein assembly factor BamE (lipoprotein component of BamABCDE complex)